jgi:hypothetical protein
MQNFLGFLLLILSINSLATEVYKCNVDGVTTFSQFPCGNDAVKVQIKEVDPHNKKYPSTRYSNDAVKIQIKEVDLHDKKYPSTRYSNDVGSPLLFRSAFATMDDRFKEYFTSNFKNEHHTTHWAKYVIGFEYDDFTRYLIINDNAPANNLLLLCSQIRAYNLNNLNSNGKVLSGEVRLRSNTTPVARYSTFFDSCSTIDGKKSVYLYSVK